MRLLLDTHVLLWILVDDRRLSRNARAIISGTDTECFVSAASWWELAMKQSRNVTSLPLPVSEIRSAALQTGLRELSVTSAHALVVADLPHLHRDPFDRMLVAQALTEPMRLMTADVQIQSYEAACGVLIEIAST